MTTPLPRLDALHISKTYGGCYAGRPPPEQMIEIAKKQAIQYFGEGRPTLVIEPKIDILQHPDLDSFSNRRLPEWQYILWAVGEALVEKDAGGSQLIVIYWTPQLTYDAGPILNGIDWSEHAEDWYF